MWLIPLYSAKTIMVETKHAVDSPLQGKTKMVETSMRLIPLFRAKTKMVETSMRLIPLFRAKTKLMETKHVFDSALQCKNQNGGIKACG
ncbi:hypothetical protein [Metabacillus idriensis]|uniref:hypothetical protein n=1 Tax=Metabacillus idriensis TaxID=324768 RepID=UPI003D292EFE